jgi:predicted PurR-regulated permease PerM
MTGKQVFFNMLIILGTVAAAYVLLISLRVLIVLLVAIIIASALRPLVTRMTGWRVPQAAAIGVIYALILITMFVFALVIVPPFFNQISQYFGNEGLLTMRIIGAQTWIEQNLTNITGSEVHLVQPDEIRALVSDAMITIQRSAPIFVTDLTGTLGDAVLIFVMGAYWLTSHERATTFIQQMFPVKHREKIENVIVEIETTLGTYVRGIVAVSLFVTVTQAIFLLLLQVPNALILSFIIGISTAIPMVGSTIGGVIAVVLTLIVSPGHVVWVFISFIGIQQLENYYISPRMMGKSTGLDPLLVIVYTTIGFVMFGVTGALIAVPLMSSFHIILEHFVLQPHKENIQPYSVEEGGVVLLKPSPDAVKTPE